MFGTHHYSPTNQTHEDPFKRSPVRIQAQQKLWNQNTPLHNAHTLLEKPIVCSNSLRLKFLLLSILYNHTSWHANFWISTRTQDLFSGLLTFFYILLKRFVTKLHSRLPALFPLALHKARVLSPILLKLHTHDCTGTDATRVTKYSDDSAIESLFNSGSVYFAEVERFCNWCRDHSLDLNVTKTK